MKTYRCKIPVWALNYLINGNDDLCENDFATVFEWKKSWDGPISVSPVGEQYFSNSPEFGLPCDVMDCEVLVHKDRRK